MTTVLQAQEAIAKFLRERKEIMPQRGRPLGSKTKKAVSSYNCHQKDYVEVVHFNRDGKKPCRSVSLNPKHTTDRKLVTCEKCKKKMNE